MAEQATVDSWANIFMARQTPQWTEADEADLQAAIKGGLVPAQHLTLPPREASPSPSFAQAPTPTEAPSVGSISPEPLRPFPLDEARRQLERPPVPAYVGPTIEPPQTPTYLSPRAEQWAKAYPQYDWLFRDFGPEMGYLMDKYAFPNLLQYGPAVVMGILTRGQSLPAQAATIGVTAAASQFGREALLAPPDTGADYGNAARRAARTGIETGGAVAVGGLMPVAAERAPLLERGVKAVGQAIGTGVGSAAGSLTAEPVAPTPSPLEHAGLTGAITSAFDLAFKGGAATANKVFGRSANIKTPAQESADLLYQENIPTPAEVSYSIPAQATQRMGGSSWFGGTRLARKWGEGTEDLSEKVQAMLDLAKRPTNPASQAEMEAFGWQPELGGHAARANEQTTAQAMYDELYRTVADQYYAAGRTVRTSAKVAGPAAEVLGQAPAGTFPQGTPEYLALQQLSAAPNMPRQQAEQLYATLTNYQQQATLPEPLMERLKDTTFALRNAIDNPQFINPSPLRQKAREIDAEIEGMLSDDARMVLRRIATASEPLSFQEANNMRSEMLAIARGQEPGGAMRAPTPAGQAPSPGEGRPMSPRIQRQARQVAETLDNMMKAQTDPLGGNIPDFLDLTHEAYALFQRKRSIERMFSDPTVYDVRDHVYNGKALLERIARVHGGEENLAEALGPEVVSNVQKIAQAISYLDEARPGGPQSIGHWIRNNMGMFTSYGLGGAFGYATGHPEAALPFLMLPDILGYIAQNVKLSNLLVTGIRAPEGSTQGWQALGRLTGILYADGVLQPPQTTTPSQDTTAAQGMATEYQQALSDPSATKAEADAYWHSVIKPLNEPVRRQAFLLAYQARFGGYPSPPVPVAP